VVALVAELLRHPAFPAEALGRAPAASLVARIEAAQRSEPSAVAGNALAAPRTTPTRAAIVRYARSFDETAGRTSRRCQRAAAVRAFHRALRHGARFAQFRRGWRHRPAGAAGKRCAQALGDWNAAGGALAYTRVPQPLLAGQGPLLPAAAHARQAQRRPAAARQPLALHDRPPRLPGA
jgi:hypothetical protein